MPASLRPLVLLLVCYVAVAVVFTWPLAKSAGSTIEAGEGDPLTIAYLLNWGAHSLLHQPARVFDAPFLYPSTNTLSYSEQLLSVSWPFAPLSLIAGPLLFHNLIVFFSYVLSATAFARYLREIGCRWSLAGLGGFLFAFSPWRFAQLGHPQFGFLWWIPLSLLFFEKWWKTPSPKWAILMGACVAGALLASIYTGLCFVLYFAAYLVARAAAGAKHFAQIGFFRVLRDLALGLAVCALLTAPSVRAYRAADVSLSGKLLSLETISRRGADILDYVNPPPYSLLWGRFSRTRHWSSDTPWEMHDYPGILVLISPAIVILAIVSRRRHDLWSGPSAAVLVSGVLLFLIAAGTRVRFAGHETGISTPYRLLFESLPGFHALRVPARAGIFPAASAIILFSISLTALREPLGRFWNLTLVIAFGISLADLAPGRLPYARSLDYERLSAAMRATDAETGPTGADLILPLQASSNFAGPLASAPRFRNLVNGRTSHWPPDSERVMANFKAASFGDDQASMIRDYDINRILLDRRAARPEFEQSLLASVQRASCLLRSLGTWDDIHVILVDCEKQP